MKAYNLKDDRPKKPWRIILIGAPSILAIVALLFFLRFQNLPFSVDPADWATFATYLGGIAGPLLTLMTIIFLIVQAEQERNRADKAGKDADRRIADEQERVRIEARIGQFMKYLEWLERDLSSKVSLLGYTAWDDLLRMNDNPRNVPLDPLIWHAYDAYIAYRAIEEAIIELDSDSPVQVFSFHKYKDFRVALEHAGYNIPQHFHELMAEFRAEEEKEHERHLNDISNR